MPIAAKRVCCYPGCAQSSYNRYCSEHKREEWNLGERTYSPSPIYSTAQWHRLRKAFLARHPICVECGELASQVDHVVPLHVGGLPYDCANLQSLCRSCHARKTLKETFLKKRQNGV
jgi:5-methylcytosine-specific restriction protein A